MQNKICSRCPLPAARFPSTAGFTLVEVLVSGIIVSAMVFLIFFSMRVFLNEWEHRRLGDVRSLAAYRTETLVRRALEGIWEYYITDPLLEREAIFYPYFKGGPQGFAFVTSSPVFSDRGTARAELLLIPSEENSFGSGRLVYREAPLGASYLRYYEDKPEYAHLLEVETDVTEMRVRYFGLFESQWDEQNETIRDIKQWMDSFDGRERNAMPEIIEITLNRDNGEPAVRTIHVKAENTTKAGLFYRE